MFYDDKKYFYEDNIYYNSKNAFMNAVINNKLLIFEIEKMNFDKYNHNNKIIYENAKTDLLELINKFDESNFNIFFDNYKNTDNKLFQKFIIDMISIINNIKIKKIHHETIMSNMKNYNYIKNIFSKHYFRALYNCLECGHIIKYMMISCKNKVREYFNSRIKIWKSEIKFLHCGICQNRFASSKFMIHNDICYINSKIGNINNIIIKNIYNINENLKNKLYVFKIMIKNKKIFKFISTRITKNISDLINLCDKQLKNNDVEVLGETMEILELLFILNENKTKINYDINVYLYKLEKMMVNKISIFNIHKKNNYINSNLIYGFDKKTEIQIKKLLSNLICIEQNITNNHEYIVMNKIVRNMKRSKSHASFKNYNYDEKNMIKISLKKNKESVDDTSLKNSVIHDTSLKNFVANDTSLNSYKLLLGSDNSSKMLINDNSINNLDKSTSKNDSSPKNNCISMYSLNKYDSINKHDSTNECDPINENPKRPILINNFSDEYDSSSILATEHDTSVEIESMRTLIYKYNTQEEIKPEEKILIRQNINLNDFEFIQIIGKGSFGVILKVRQIKTNEIFAIKICEIKNKNQILKEKKIMKKMYCDFIIKLYYVFTCNDYICFVMEYVDGCDLFTFLDKNTYIEENDAKYIIAEILLGLEFLKNINIIHNDIKTRNIIINKSGHIKLIDFGLSNYSYEKNNHIKGTPDYMAPELLSENPIINSANDIWSFGCVIYELLTGISPFNDKSIHVVFDNIINKNYNWPEFEDCSFCYKIKDLISKIFVDYDKRIVLEDIKNHQYFDNFNWSDTYLLKNNISINKYVFPENIIDVKSYEHIINLFKNQNNNYTKLEYADFVINNNDLLHVLNKQKFKS